jgi:hypothetical protein
MRITPEHITELKPNEIFTFGSNLRGVHGLGAAKQGVKWGAIYGQGEGLMGQTYALPTKDDNLKTLPLRDIRKHIDKFIEVIEMRQDLTFLVTAIGTGLAGYQIGVMAHMFKRLLKYDNVYLPKEFTDCYEDYENYWNTLTKFETPNDVPDLPRVNEKTWKEYYVPKLIAAGAMPLKDLENGGYYLGKCRNTYVAQWLADEKKFYYFRHKWGLAVDDTINHFEMDNGYDLFVPIKKVTKKEFDETR